MRNWTLPRKTESGTQVAVVNYDGIRIPYVSPGAITKGKIYEMMPFDNKLTIVEVPGKVLRQLCNLIAAYGGWPVSGLSFEIKDEKAVNILVAGKPVNDQLIYLTAMSDYIANGGDNCDFFTGCKKRYLNIFVRDMLIDYTTGLQAKGEKLNPKLEKESAMQNRRSFIKHGVLGGGLLAGGAFPFSAFAAGTSTRITVLHTNDVHSRLDPFPMDGTKFQGLGGVAARAALVQKIRSEEEHVLLLDAGDIFQGTPYFNLYKGEPEIKAMSMLGYDAVTMGNHDFDAGVEGFALQLQHANFPVLVANYDFRILRWKKRPCPIKF